MSEKSANVDIYFGEAVNHILENMQKEGAPKEAASQLLSMLLEMSARLFLNDDIVAVDKGLECETKKGKMELYFGGDQAQ